MNHQNDISNLRLARHGHVPGDTDTLAMEQALDALGAVERAGMPVGVADRVFTATRMELGPRVAARIGPAHSESIGSAWRTGNLMTPLRAAAGLAIAATVGISVVAHRAPSVGLARIDPAASNLEHYIDWWASNTDGLGTDLSARASALDAESSALRDTITGGTASYDLWAEEGAL